jgi:Uma2 family endonuclease
MATTATADLSAETQPILSEELLHEVIDGKVVEKANMGTFQKEFATILANFLGPPARRGGYGRVIVEAIVRIDDRTQYRPDIAFVSFDKWPRRRRTPDKEPWEIIPDLAIEVVSKNDKSVDVLRKVRHYFQVGVRGVWLVYPTLEVFHLYDSFDQIRVLTREGVLDGGAFIPGFQLPLETLFEEMGADEDPDDPAD